MEGGGWNVEKGVGCGGGGSSSSLTAEARSTTTATRSVGRFARVPIRCGATVVLPYGQRLAGGTSFLSLARESGTVVRASGSCSAEASQTAIARLCVCVCLRVCVCVCVYRFVLPLR